jgi:hypothetical protein
MLRWVGIIALAVVLGISIWFVAMAHPLTKTALLQPRGDNVAPRYFEIPQDLKEAVAHLQVIGFSLYSIEQSDHCMFHKFDSGRQVYLFEDKTWRQGTMCIVPDGANVAEVYWLFQPGAP